MFARIEEFAAHVEGPLVAESLAEALASIRRGERVAVDEQWLEQRRAQSQRFLRNSI